MKRCKTCRKSKEEGEFNHHSTNPDHLQSSCRKCQRSYGKKWLTNNADKNIGYCSRYYKKNKQKWRERFYKNTYNMTLEDIEILLETQDNRCPICEMLFKNTRQMHVDHCHKTGKLRQILCSKCNTALGLLDENIKRFEKAIHYLNKWNNVCVQPS